MPQKIFEFAERIANPAPFFQAMFKDLRNKMLASLRENTPGERLWNEWSSKLQVAGSRSELTIFHRRLEGDRGHWEPIFGYLNEGTRTHWVEPINAQALRWEDESGEVHFSKGHIVSGILPAYFAETADRVVSDFEDGLEKKWSIWISTGRYRR